MTKRIKNPVEPSGERGVAGDVARVTRIAGLALSPSFNAAAVTATFGETAFGKLDTLALSVRLADECKKVNGGDLGHMESMLMAQAHALQAIFTNLARRAHQQEYLTQFEAHLRLALKSQSQCRATLETLAAIKNPASVAFVRQANISHGPQQVNNGISNDGLGSRAGEMQNTPNELLEVSHASGERMDFSTARTPSRTDKNVEAMVEVNRPADKVGEGKSITKRLSRRDKN